MLKERSSSRSWPESSLFYVYVEVAGVTLTLVSYFVSPIDQQPELQCSSVQIKSQIIIRQRQMNRVSVKWVDPNTTS